MTITFKNYATLTLTDKPNRAPLVLMNFSICDDGYAGFCIQPENFMVDVSLPSHPRFKIICEAITGIGAIGGRGSDPNGEYGEPIRRGFVETVGSWIVENLAYQITTEDNPKIFATLEIRGNYTQTKEWKLEKDFKIIEAA